MSPDHPAAGAGTIHQAGEKQVYSFTGTATQVLYVGIGPCDGATPSFDLIRPDDTPLTGRGGCQADLGNVTLPRTGTYVVIVTAPGPAHYAFSLRAPRTNQYAIAIGDLVSPDHPAAGAGIINELGEKQTYSFAANAGDAVYVSLGPCDGASPHFELLRPDGTTLDYADCHADISRQDLGRQPLPATGAYRIVVSTDKANVSSRYSFYVHAVPPDEHFAAQLPLNVSPGAPSRTAGRIAAQGAQQFFDFTASPGSVVHIESKCSCPNLAIRAGAVGDTSRFGYFDLLSLKNDWRLPAGGRYTIQVRSNGYVGTYSFTATQAASQRH